MILKHCDKCTRQIQYTMDVFDNESENWQDWCFGCIASECYKEAQKQLAESISFKGYKQND